MIPIRLLTFHLDNLVGSTNRLENLSLKKVFRFFVRRPNTKVRPKSKWYLTKDKSPVSEGESNM